MAGLRRISDWATVPKLAAVADLLFKFTALVAALAAANFFYFQPTARLTTSAQTFIDPAEVGKAYALAGQTVPDVVEGVVQAYNRHNRRDLNGRANSTLAMRPQPAELCATMRRLVQRVFRDADCATSSIVLGRGRFYERLLLDSNAASRRPLQAAQLRGALAHMYAAEYRRARTWTKNAGNAKAANIRIRMSDGFVPRSNQANDPFSLDKGQQFRRDFETARGDYDEHPTLEFGVDWDRASLGNSSVTAWVATLLLAAFLFVVANDIIRSFGRDDRPPPDDGAMRPHAASG